MAKLHSFGYQEHRSSAAASSSSFALPAHLFMPVPTLSLASAHRFRSSPDQSVPLSPQAKKKSLLKWNVADIPLFPDPATLPSIRSGFSALPSERPVSPPLFHPFAIQVIQRRERDETPEQNSIPQKISTNLPDALKSGIEKRSGLSMNDVRVHYHSSRPAKVQALAYTQGAEIHIGPGQEQHLAHEAWHVVQQKQGRVKPTMQTGEALINDDEKLEREADQIGASFMPDTASHWSSQPRAAETPSVVYNTSHYPIQRTLWVGSKGENGTPVNVTLIDDVIAAFTLYESEKNSKKKINKTIRKKSLYKALEKRAYTGKKLALLNLLKTWVTDAHAGDDRIHKTWDDAVIQASLYLNAEAAHQALTPEQRADNNRKISDLIASLPLSEKDRIDEKTLSSEERAKYGKELFPRLLRSASFGTDIFPLPNKSAEDANIPLPVERRKRHKAGESNLPGHAIHYRTYTEGTISPKANAFVLGGSLATDYKPLLEELVRAIVIETKDSEKPFTDKEVAGLFLQEFAGKDAFASFSLHAQKLAHKIIAIIFFAELSRHSIALLSAIATFHAIASREETATEPSLEGSFATGSKAMRPLFAGTGGPDLMRGKEAILEMTEDEILTRRARATIDLLNYFNATKGKDEDISTFVQKKTTETIFNLSPHTHQKLTYSSLIPSELFHFLTSIRDNKSKTNNSVATLTTLGFNYHPQPGDQNDCAIYTIYDQLTRVHGVNFGAHTREEFVNNVRRQVGVTIGQMIDLSTHGLRLLQATQSFFSTNLNPTSPPLIIDIWSATGDGGLLEFQNVSQSPGTGSSYVLTFYYNGIDHFDSLSNGLSRHSAR